VADAGGVVVGVEEGGVVLDGGGVEQDEVGAHAGAEEAAVGEIEALGGEGGHPADGVFEGDDLAFADIAGEDAGEGAIAARVGGIDTEGGDAAVGGDHGEGVAEDPFDVVFVDGVIDGRTASGLLEFDGDSGGVFGGGGEFAGAGDVRERFAGEGGIVGAGGDDDVFGIAGAAVVEDPVDDFGLDFGAGSGGVEAFGEGFGAAGQGPLGEQGGDAGGGGGVRVLVDGDIDAAGAGFLDEAQRLADLPQAALPMVLWWVTWVGRPPSSPMRMVSRTESTTPAVSSRMWEVWMPPRGAMARAMWMTSSVGA
jgi:hypothetical protein